MAHQSLHLFDVWDYDYDKKTGQGELTFTGYFKSDGFKIVKNPGSWDDQWGSSDGTESSLILKDGGDIKPAEGYYKLTMDTKKSTLKMEKVDISPATYETMGIIGLNGDWLTGPEGTLKLGLHRRVSLWPHMLKAESSGLEGGMGRKQSKKSP